MSEKEEKQVEIGMMIFCLILAVIYAVAVGVFGVHRASGFWFCTGIFIECFTTTLIGGIIGGMIGLWMRNYVGGMIVYGRSQTDLFFQKLSAQIGLPLGGVLLGGFLLLIGVGKLLHGEAFLKWNLL